jgi:hypothetical protein
MANGNYEDKTPLYNLSKHFINIASASHPRSAVRVINAMKME